jgi:predicted peroxiredoxin
MESSGKEYFIILCASGFENPERVRSALMFATLAATANYRTILFCVQNAVDVMVKGAVEKAKSSKSKTPTIAQRLQEALEMGVEIQCCSQTMANKGLTEKDLLDGATVAGAMNLIALATEAKGILCF